MLCEIMTSGRAVGESHSAAQVADCPTRGQRAGNEAYQSPTIFSINTLFEGGPPERSGAGVGEDGQMHVRLSFAPSVKEIEQGMKRPKEALQDL